MVKTVGIFILNISVLVLTACNSIDSKPIKENQIQDNDIEIFLSRNKTKAKNIVNKFVSNGFDNIWINNILIYIL